MQHKLSLIELIGWAEDAIMEGGFEPGHEETLRNALGKLGAADADSFGLLWEDCQQLIQSLGYEVKVEAALAASSIRTTSHALGFTLLSNRLRLKYSTTSSLVIPDNFSLNFCR